jgi:pimeloyl-ACP methyl ester carboxylesterase
MRYLLIHGIGNQDPQEQWFRDATIFLPDDLKAHFQPFYWEDLREPALEKHLQQARIPCLQTFLALSGLMDLLTYGDTLKNVFDRLDATITEATEPIILVAHSLGSVLAYEYLCRYGTQHGKVLELITLGSPIGRQPVSGRIRKRLGSLCPLPVHWINVAGTHDWVTSWWPAGAIKEADMNICLPKQTHDLATYLRAIG